MNHSEFAMPCDAVAGFDFHLQEFLMMVDGIRDGESWVPLYDLTPSLMHLGLSRALSCSSLISASFNSWLADVANRPN